ncbi:2-oxoglutarate dehydrogenase complex dihydrolipoyllysine-residue succinyltransferase [Anatilimnocola sp. NA78]|uniref:2-oxoglutarate dehydrogenase complex dihydrolipoyllysine-residue succinyltransferase n=1 Tax=Anatilimnocola sp. NA78 TaxID=3415683 RepID=UPI003CE46817
MSTEVTVPAMGESISEAVILRWLKADGDQVAADEPICELETDKATFDLPAPVGGVLTGTREVGTTVHVGEVVAQIDTAAVEKPRANAATKPPAKQGANAQPPPAQESPPRAARPEVHKTQPSREEKPQPVPSAKPDTPKPVPKTYSRPHPAAQPSSTSQAEGNGQRREPMSKMRKRIAERLVRAQHTAAMLTTFNEIDMTNILNLREQHKEQFEKAHGVSLGLMSFFSRATALAIKHFPVINAEIDGDDVVYHEDLNLGIAVNTERGLVVPVLRNAGAMSFAQIEGEIKRVAAAARDGKLALEELSGGTFTITNGGVFGSLLSTPILNPPQSAILGMHTIQRRPVCIGKRIRGRRMMYVALSYDHRLVDGRDAVQFLVKIKQLLEEPLGMLLED